MEGAWEDDHENKLLVSSSSPPSSPQAGISSPHTAFRIESLYRAINAKEAAIDAIGKKIQVAKTTLTVIMGNKFTKR